jgi:hypothetical protein
MPVVLPALALDATIWLLARHSIRLAVLAGAAVFAAIHIGLMTPMIEQVTRLPHLPEGAVARALPWAVVAAALAAWAGLWLGQRLADWGKKSI